ncbi:MAG: flagellar export protein FliJ [Burkholderiaceae bacterium]|jgi:flagellar protein FliJ|uniref:flagellar export protein FliJ n=1 Tax=Hylemonella sp. TaxID=2066020 RepID=UPI0035AF8D17|nr:flagellar export protein FliJ [Burkholderiaceae bacterium]
MSALTSLTLAIEVAERARDQADQAWQQARRGLQFARGQLEQLESYAADTEARWGTAAAVTVSAELMRHHQHFMQRLRHAMGLQTGVVNDLERQAETARVQRVQQEVRLKALQQLLEKKLAERARLQARREQKQMDEMAILAHARNGAVAGRRMTGESL